MSGAKAAHPDEDLPGRGQANLRQLMSLRQEACQKQLEQDSLSRWESPAGPKIALDHRGLGEPMCA